MFKLSGDRQIDNLNLIVPSLAKGQDDGFGALSTGQQCYVALASNRVDLLESIGYTIPAALGRLDDSWTQALVSCWQHAGNPAKY